jgi:hypothetical protein
LKGGEAALQVNALDAVGHQRQSASIRIRRSLESAEAAQQVGAAGVERDDARGTPDRPDRTIF